MPCHRITVLLIATSLPFIGTAQVAPAPTAGVQAPPTSVQQVIPAQTNPTSDADSAASIDAPRAHLATQLPAVTPGNRPVIGLALEGGGALGLAHIGVLQWFEQNHIPIDRIAGTSMGALVGAFYATGHSPKQMREIAVSDEFARVFTLQTPYADSSYRRRQDRRQIPAVATIGLAHGAILRNSLLTNRGINEFLTAHLLAYNSRRIDYNQLPIPFRCVATDLNDFSPRIFGNGSLPQAVRASISIPGVFSPVEDTAGHYLVDGGIVNNLPADVVRNELHADKVIAIRIEDAPLAPSDVSSIVGVLNRAFSVGIVHNVDEAAKQADAVILLSLNSYSGTDYSKGVELIDAGFKAANEQGKGLLRYALNDTDWAAYQAARGSHQFAEPGRLQQVRVAGGVVAAQAEVKVDFKPIEGQPITAARIFNALKPIQSNGDYGASFETFSPPSGSALASAAGSSSPRSKAPDTGVLVRLSQDPTGPLYLILGPEFAASTSSISRSELESRIVYQNLGGFGSELRATQQVGYLTHLTAEYYRLLTPKGYFLQPSAGFLREPVYIWSNQKRVAERLLQSYGTGIEFGRTIGYSTQISAEWRGEDRHWALTTGAGGGPYVSGTAQTSLLHINVDHETSGSVSPSGFRLSAAVGALYHAEASADAPLIEISTNHTWQWRGSNIFGLTGDLNSYMRANVAQPYRFTLGGPQRLSASAFDEYRGTDTYLVRAGFLHRMASLPTGLGHGLYTVCGYEAGEIWSPESHAILRQDGTLGILAATPLGSITLGGAVGDAGHRKIFITVGRLF